MTKEDLLKKAKELKSMDEVSYLKYLIYLEMKSKIDENCNTQLQKLLNDICSDNSVDICKHSELLEQIIKDNF